ncbi:MAG: tRNA (adenosine(37)-N6)-threonylcarbamoyltransferase complex ATPase subunit type 1 TsaE [bacterium]|nr:tRNA (adenosine(37)-N6)-threonylcarbamoyltransferase complex ATPase subunit type 1 TsaE [bacterium]
MTPAPEETITQSPEETERLGGRFAGSLVPGSIVLIYGEVGAGKSVFVRGLVHGLPGGEGRSVRSPTFVYMTHHPTQPPVRHVDLYRLPANFDPDDLDLGEATDAGEILIFEWAEKLRAHTYPEAHRVQIDVLDAHRRRIRLGG